MAKYEIETNGHVWMREEDGSIDIFGYSSGHCNGPRCSVCGYGFCHHCHDEVPQNHVCSGIQDSDVSDENDYDEEDDYYDEEDEDDEEDECDE
jgi:hypothetical protein